MTGTERKPLISPKSGKITQTEWKGQERGRVRKKKRATVLGEKMKQRREEGERDHIYKWCSRNYHIRQLGGSDGGKQF